MATLTEETNLIELLQFRATERPKKRVLTFLTGDENETHALTFEDLDAAARAIAARLQALDLERERAFLVYRPGPDFVAAFFGCLYAGVVAVPVYPVRPGQKLTRLTATAGDARPRAVLTTRAALPNTREELGPHREFEGVHWIATDDPRAQSAAWRPPSVDGATLAFLQYTSGSTGSPKGVMITHGNILRNQQIIQRAFGHSENSVGVGWLPLFHDMGLIGHILQPVYAGCHCVLMSPEAFLQKPSRWLAAVSRYRATTSGGPDFAYELCVRRVSAEQRDGLDLSHWEVAFTGAEPVRRSTLEAFTAAFAPCGFRREAFYPCYGLAEATLMVTGGEKLSCPVIAEVDAAALEAHRAVPSVQGRASRSIVGCGHTFLEQQVRIVEPGMARPCADGSVGEIWVSGPSVALGYWNQPELNRDVFDARTAGDGTAARFLRTGDLGFLKDGTLFVTGRLKDLIIVRGRNHYPHDIELTAQGSHPALAGGSGAAFSLDVDGAEQLVILHEVDRKHLRGLDGQQVIDAVRGAVAREHEIQAHSVVLLSPMGLLRTSSGKIRRSACRLALLDGALPLIAEWTQPPSPSLAVDAPSSFPRPDVAGSLIAWLRAYGAQRLNSRVIDERRCIPPYVVLDFGNRGLLGLQVPERYGGLGLGHRDAMRVFVQLAAMDLTLASFVGVHHSLGTRPILNFATPAVRDEWLPALARGRELASFAITEPGAGSNPRAMVSVASPDGNGGWRIRGQKSWIGTASWSGVINVFVKQLDSAGSPIGVTGFVLRQGSQGLRNGPEALTMGMRGMVQNSIELDGVRVGPADVLGRPGLGLDVAQDAMMHGRLGLGAISVGGMKRCAQLMLRYSQRRSVSTGRLLDNPVTLARMGALTAATTALEALVDTIGRLLDEGRTVAEEGYIACKVCGPELLWQAADWLVQLLGGRGYVETNCAPQLLRDARLLRIFEGPTEALTMHLGSRALQRGHALQDFIGQHLAAPDVAAQLADALEGIQARVTRRVEGTEPPGGRWASYLAGEVTASAILLASVEASARKSDAPAVHRAAKWARLSFAKTAASALVATPEEAVRTDPATMADLVSSYAESIGDLEQTLPGEDHAFDDYLRKAVTPSAAPPLDLSQGTARVPAERRPTAPIRDRHVIEDWIVRWLVTALKTNTESIDIRKSFFEFGLDSIKAVELAHDLEEWLGGAVALDPTIAWNFPTIERLAAHLAEQDGHEGPEDVQRPRGPVEGTIVEELEELEGLLEQRRISSNGRTDVPEGMDPRRGRGGGSDS